MVRTSKAQKKEVTISPVRSRLSAFASKFFESKSDAKRMAIQAESRVTRRGALKSMAALLGLSVVTACAPSLVQAEPKDSTSKSRDTSKKEAKGVTYETFSDPKELEPYFKNAEGKLVTLKPNQEKKIGEYVVSMNLNGSSVDFNVRSKDGTYEEWGITLNSRMNEVNILAIDMGESNPLIKGTMLVLADNSSVFFQFFDKMKNAHSLAGVPLGKGRMRVGPIKTGFEVDKDGILVLSAPEKLMTGDIVVQANLWSNGDSGGQFYVYAPDKPTGTLVASL